VAEADEALATQALATAVKRALRQRMASLRRAVPPTARAQRSARIVEQVAALPWFRHATGVELYAAMPERGEVDIAGLDELCRAQGKRVYYPFMDAGSQPGVFVTGFRQVQDLAELCSRGKPFAEPDPTCAAALAHEIDFIVVPALAATPSGQRLGSGSGFYDATLPDFPTAKSCVVVFSFQLVGELPIEPHDRACDIVCSDGGPS
jgi:5-formyltetrahydrofolate cyclo-ligase